jgi:hypothetical protein
VTRLAARVASVAAAVAGALALGGCAQMTNPTYDLSEVGCSTVPDATLQALQATVSTGTLRNARQVTEGDTTFVSAELHRPDEDAHAKGDLLTWASDPTTSPRFAAVDERAREESTERPASFDIRAHGGRESRACVGPSRGKTPAQLHCEREQANSGTPASGRCEDL